MDQSTRDQIVSLLLKLLNGTSSPPASPASDWIGQYVIVRCRDAGVHAGVLESASGRTCRLAESRRLWRWTPAHGAAFLSGVAASGLDGASKVGTPVDLVLTEDCEIIRCTEAAERSIRSLPDYSA